ncbi:hypothetical protein EC973_000279 [Apophysomyces ossiformis]|uniref:Rhodanese domain-containing protein n=1 Tax=Apophysomyces ossiformis TaxID=679940 RepID=A0A8H7BX58_9FUNG|nr:hypothetical protein EC973_000279 [Apophysomyces ossiformis]
MYGRQLLSRALFFGTRSTLRQLHVHARRSANVSLHYSHVAPVSPFTTRLIHRGYSSDAAMSVDYDEIRSIISSNRKDTHLIDVREPAELSQGSIPTAKNIPLSNFANAWATSSEEFLDIFGFQKPGLQENIVLYCQAGIRSAKAAEYLRQLGYSRVRNYDGSWVDYSEKSKKV